MIDRAHATSARGTLALVLVTALAASLGACTNRSAPAPAAATASTSQAPTDSTDTGSMTDATTAAPGDPAALAEVARTAGTPLGSGDLILSVAAPTEQVSVAAQDDGSALLTVAVVGDPDPDQSTSTAPDRLAAVLAAPTGLVFDVLTDRSVTVTASTGAVVGALLPVTVVDGAGSRLLARLAARADDPALLDVLVSAGPPAVATLTFGAEALVSAVWGDREGGRSLAVVPAAWVRTGSLAAQATLWSALVAAEPDADSTSMRDQLDCHALGAPTKESWNLEPWRPAVDSFTLLAARCNP